MRKRSSRCRARSTSSASLVMSCSGSSLLEYLFWQLVPFARRLGDRHGVHLHDASLRSRSAGSRTTQSIGLDDLGVPYTRWNMSGGRCQGDPIVPLRLTHLCTCGDVRTSMPNSLDDCSTAVPPVFGMCIKLWPGGRRKHPGATQLASGRHAARLQREAQGTRNRLDLLWPSSLTGLIAAFAGPLRVAVRVSVIFGRMTRALTSREACVRSASRLILYERASRHQRAKLARES